MSSGKANFNYIQFKDNYLLSQEFSIDDISKKEKIDVTFNQVLLSSEDLSHLVKFDNIGPLSHISFDLFQKILDIHIFLLTNTELSNRLKLKYCNLERFFMKKYLNEIIKKNSSK